MQLLTPAAQDIADFVNMNEPVELGNSPAVQECLDKRWIRLDPSGTYYWISDRADYEVYSLHPTYKDWEDTYFFAQAVWDVFIP